jgi:hypothetical protein
VRRGHAPGQCSRLCVGGSDYSQQHGGVVRAQTPCEACASPQRTSGTAPLPGTAAAAPPCDNSPPDMLLHASSYSTSLDRFGGVVSYPCDLVLSWGVYVDANELQCTTCVVL